MRWLGLLTLVIAWNQPAFGQGADRLLERAAAARAKGQQGAPVMVFEIADFQCPFCARFAREVFPLLDSAYIKTGKVQWFFVNLPLPNHGAAWTAAEAAMCAGAIGDKFWQVHDRLYATQSEWPNAANVSAAVNRLVKEAGVSGSAYDACVAEDRMASLILQDVLFSANLKPNGTPTFIIDNQITLTGVKTFEEWRELLDKALKKPK
jgi:protein-disulfide isomerase